MERFKGIDSKTLRKYAKAGGTVALAGTTALGAIQSASVVRAEASSQTVKINCGVKDAWYPKPLTQGDTVELKASAAVLAADVSVDGQAQYDNNEHTATVIGLKSKNNSDADWTVNVDYGGSVYVLHCGAGSSPFYEALGRIGSIVDQRLGQNDATESTQLQVIKK